MQRTKLKIITTLMVLILTLTVMGSLVACNDSSDSSKNSVELTIHDGDKTYTANAEYGKDVNLISTYETIYSGKQGYYIEGLYDSANGGTKYFDKEGDCKSIWSENYPTDLYVKWESIDNYLLLDDLWWGTETNPTEYSSNCGSTDYTYLYYEFKSKHSSGYLIINNNRDRQIHATINVRAKTSNARSTPLHVYLRDGNGNGNETYAHQSLPLTTSYEDLTFETDCSMKTFGYYSSPIQRRMYIGFYVPNNDPSFSHDRFYYKDLHVSISILPKE